MELHIGLKMGEETANALTNHISDSFVSIFSLRCQKVKNFFVLNLSCKDLRRVFNDLKNSSDKVYRVGSYLDHFEKIS